MDRRLHETTLKGDMSTISALIEEDESMIDQRVAGSSSATVLHLAARLGSVELARVVVRLRPEMAGAVNDRSETPLHEACREGRLEVVRFLVETDESSVYRLSRETGTSCLFVASERGKVEVVRFLLSFHELLMLELDGSSTTSLHVAASGGYTEIVKEILKARPDFMWKKDPDGCTPLHHSCKKGHLDITRELLRFDPDLSISQDDDGRTPLHWAAIKGRVNIMDEILSASLESAEMITRNGETVLHLAAKHNQYEAVQYLTETLDFEKLLNVPNNDGNTVLHIATARKFSTMAIYFLELGVHVNAINRKGQTALDILQSYVCPSSVALLILPPLLKAGGKESDQLPPISRESGQIEQDNLKRGQMPPSSSRNRMSLKTPTQHHRRTRRRRENQLELQMEGLLNARNTIILVAVLVATVTFAAGVNPPGGFNQQTGESLLGKSASFKVFGLCNIVALFLSLGIVVFLVSIVPFRRKPLIKLLVVTHRVMWLSISFMAAAYIAAMWTILPHGIGRGRWVFMAMVGIGVGCTVAMFAGLSVLLAKHWIRKLEWRRNKDRKKNGSPDSSVSRVLELGTMRKHSRQYSDEDSSNADFYITDMEGYHVY